MTEYYGYPHLTDEETEAYSLSPLHELGWDTGRPAGV